MKQFAIIGLDSFGIWVLEELLAVDAEVLIVDKSEEIVSQYKNQVHAAYVADAIKEETVRKIIRKDLDTLRRSDVVICLWDDHVKNGGGTHGEMTMAHELGIPVHLVLGMPQESVSSWILGCASRVHTDFETLRKALSQEIGQG